MLISRITRPAIGGEIAHKRRGAAIRGEYCEAAGAVWKELTFERRTPAENVGLEPGLGRFRPNKEQGRSSDRAQRHQSSIFRRSYEKMGLDSGVEKASYWLCLT
jgi:hypothetical protein